MQAVPVACTESRLLRWSARLLCARLAAAGKARLTWLLAFMDHAVQEPRQT